MHLKDMNLDIVSNEDFCIHVLNNLPVDYEVQQVSKLEDCLESMMNALTIEDLQTN